MVQKNPKKAYKARGNPKNNPKNIRRQSVEARGFRVDGTAADSKPQHERHPHMMPAKGL